MPWFVNYTCAAYVDKWKGYPGDQVTAEAPLGLRHDGPSPKWREFVRDPIASGDPHGATRLPIFSIVLTSNRQSLPDSIEIIFDRSVCDFTISDRVRRIIKSFEPDRHFFFPVEIYRRDMTPWPERYWSFKAAPSAVAQAIIVEQSERVEWVPVGNSVRGDLRLMKFDIGPHITRDMIIEEGRNVKTLTDIEDGYIPEIARDITVDEAVFVHRHIVKEAVYRDSRILFFSDELVAALKQEKVRGFKWGRMKSAKREVPPYTLGELEGEVR
jgi:hypothetical protein